MSGAFITLIDWNRNSIFEKPDEDVSADVDGAQVMWWSRGKNQSKVFASAAAGEFNAVLKNFLRKYSIWNTDSPLSGYLKPGCDIQISTVGAAGEDFSFADGTAFEFADGESMDIGSVAGRVVGQYILDGLPQRVRKEERRVGIPGLGVFSRLTNTTITTGLYQNITTSEAIEIILDAVGWPADKRNIQAGLTTVFWFHLDKANPFAEIQRLVDTEGVGASWYEDIDGTFVFENRDSRTTQIRSTVPQAVFSDLDWHVQDLEPDANFKDEIKGCRITIEEKQPQPLAPIWSWDSEIVLGPNESRTFKIKTREPFLNAQIPNGIASNTIFTLTGSQALLSGGFKLEYLGIQTAVLNYNLTAGDAQTALEDLYGAGNVSCTGGPLNIRPIFCELSGGDYAGQNITSLPTVVDSTLNPHNIPGGITVTKKQAASGGLIEIQIFTASGILVSGAWAAEITFLSGTFQTVDLPYNATAQDIEDAFVDIFGLEQTVCFFGPINTTEVEARFVDISNAPINDVIIIPSPTDPLMMQEPGATVDIAVSQQGGIADYVITDGSLYQVMLDPQSGTGATLIYRADTAGVILAPGSRVRAQTLSVVRTQEITYPENLDGLEGKIDAPNVLPDISEDDARMIAEARVLFYENARTTTPIRHETSLLDPAGIDLVFSWQISDMVTVENFQSGLSHNGHIENFRYEVHGAPLLKLITYIGWEMAA